jgi:CheY-specific phosphatase CheX
MSQSTHLPSREELLDVLRESVHEVFSSTVSSFKQATQVVEQGERALSIRDDSGNHVTAAIDLEAAVKFTGQLNGAVVVRCSAQGAMDIARGLLMLDANTSLAVPEIEDALGECANMVSGVLKRRALDPRGSFALGLPEIRRTRQENGKRGGMLVYQLSEGVVSMELWLDA